MSIQYHLQPDGSYKRMSNGGITIASAPDLRSIGKQIISGKIKRIILLGDSSTDGEGGSGYVASESGKQSVNYNGYCWANLLKKFLGNRYGVQVENCGYRGSAAGYQFQEIAEQFPLGEGVFVIWLCGANNRVSDALYQDYDANIAPYIAQVKAQSPQGLLMMTNAPVTASADSWVPYTTSDMRDSLVRNCHPGVHLLDMHSAYIDRCRAKGIKVDDTMSDAYHCNDAGYELMFHILLDAIGIPTDPYEDYSPEGELWQGMRLLIDTGTDDYRIQETLEKEGLESNVWTAWATQVPFVMMGNPGMTNGVRHTLFSGKTLRRIRFAGVGMVPGSLTIGSVDISTFNSGTFPALKNSVTVQVPESGVVDFGEEGLTVLVGHTLGIGHVDDTARLCYVRDDLLTTIPLPGNAVCAYIPSKWMDENVKGLLGVCAAFYEKI